VTVQHPNRITMHTYVITRRAIEVTVERLLAELELMGNPCPDLPGPTCNLCGCPTEGGWCPGCDGRDQT
jgi:hypothetical protein